MKNFTKVLTACAFCFGISSISLAQYDVSVYQIDAPTMACPVNGAMQTPIDIRFKNLGASPIPAATQVEIHVEQDGTPMAPITGFTIPSGGMASGADLGFPGPPTVQLVAPAGSSTQLCFTVVVVGNTDPNTANDEMCQTYTWENGTTVDLQMTDLKIVVPVKNAGDTLKNGIDFITEMNVTITNKGDFTYPVGFAVPYSLEVEGEIPNTVTGQLAACLAPNTSTTRQITNTLVIPDIPTTVGPFKYCATAMITNDVDPTNNKTCTNYYAGKGTGGPSGIEDIVNDEAFSSVYYNNSNKTLNLFLSNQVSGELNLILTNTNGQMVKNMTINANNEKEQIDLSNASNGFYMLTLRANDGQVETHKFIVN